MAAVGLFYNRTAGSDKSVVKASSELAELRLMRHAMFVDQDRAVKAIAMSKHDDSLAISSGKMVEILRKDNENYQSIGHIEVVGRVRAVAFHPSAKRIAIGATDMITTILLYIYTTTKIEPYKLLLHLEFHITTR